MEAPSPRIGPILAIFQAYLMASPWLRAVIQPDRMRTVLPFIEPFSELYQKIVLAPDYTPSLEEFIDEYCLHNPSKNRELNLLPLLTRIAPDAVERALGFAYPTDRPTFHYRLPNARAGNPNWSIAEEWNRWVTIEKLALDASRLDKAKEAWNQMRADGTFKERWISLMAAELTG
ncbi:MAG: amidoligase family protein [Breoghania sp.]|nr:amidoligase family protein [Breoghania sp.]